MGTEAVLKMIMMMIMMVMMVMRRRRRMMVMTMSNKNVYLRSESMEVHRLQR
jgi:hypothetical protein